MLLHDHPHDHRSLRLLCTELLEGRRLLSALTSTLVADLPPPNVAVEVLEHEAISDDDDGDSVEIETNDLPGEVIAALNAQLPGAELIAAELSDEDGETEYEVEAMLDGEQFELAFTPDGELVEHEQIISADQLPQAVLDWIRAEHPDAEIDEAAIVTENGRVSYDVDLSTDAGDFEATLGLIESPETPDTGGDENVLDSDADGSIFDFVAEPTTVPSDDLELPTEAGAGEAADQIASEQVAQPADTDGLLVAQANSASVVAANGPTPFATTRAALIADAVQALAAGAAPMWMPQMAGALGSALSIDVLSVEGGLEQILGEIDSLAEIISSDDLLSNGSLRLAAVIAILAGIRIMCVDSRKPGGGPLLSLTAQNLNLSWMLGSRSRRT